MKRIVLVLAMAALAGNAVAQSLRDDRSYPAGPVVEKNLFKKSYSLRDSKSDWFDPAVSIDQLNSQTTFFRSTMFPDSNILTQYSNGLGEVGWHSVGMLMDPRSVIYESSPFKMSRWNTYTVDSIAFLYMYSRWNPNPAIVDSIRVTTFTGADVLTYTNLGLGTVNYNRPENRASGTTVQSKFVELNVEDTIMSRWGIIALPIGRTVLGSNNGANWFGASFSYIPGDKSYSKTEPFDTLDCRSFPNVIRRFNQFEFQLAQDASAYAESPTGTTGGARILNNGFMVNTGIRYALYTGNLAPINNSYYGGTWTNTQNQSFTYAPRVLFKLSTNNYSVNDLTQNGVSVGMPYPNPASNGHDIAVDFKLTSAADVTVTLQDLNGRVMQHIAKGKFAAGENTVSFKPEGLKAGMYLVTVSNGTGISTGKLVIE
jgi:hypothetical protein